MIQLVEEDDIIKNTEARSTQDFSEALTRDRNTDTLSQKESSYGTNGSEDVSDDEKSEFEGCEEEGSTSGDEPMIGRSRNCVDLQESPTNMSGYESPDNNEETELSPEAEEQRRREAEERAEQWREECRAFYARKEIATVVPMGLFYAFYHCPAGG